MVKDRQEKEHLAAELNAIHNRTKVVHMITVENKKRLWKLLRKFFSKKQLSNSHLKELYEYIDQGFSVEDFQDRITLPLPAREPTMNLLQIQLRKLLNESEATFPTEKPAEGNTLSRKSQEADPNVPSYSQPQASLEGSATAEDENVPYTFESETSSGSSSGDASE